MDISSTAAVERIARVLAAHRLSANADGVDTHAAARVDETWESHRDEAIEVLKSLREPDADMERAGDVAVWQRMVDAALGKSPIPEFAEADFQVEKFYDEALERSVERTI